MDAPARRDLSEDMMSDFFSDIPQFSPRSASAGPNPTQMLAAADTRPPLTARSRMPLGRSRRGFLRAAAAGAGALALTGLNWVGERLPAYAGRAEQGRKSLHPSNCMGATGMGYPCFGRMDIGPEFVGTDTYHRLDSERVTVAGVATLRVYGWAPACGDWAGWVWKTTDPARTIYCWDGQYCDRVEGSAEAFIVTTSAMYVVP